MSRQRAGWGLTRWIERASKDALPKSETAGKNKYDPKTASREGEMERRRVALAKLKEKADRKRANKP